MISKEKGERKWEGLSRTTCDVLLVIGALWWFVVCW